MASANKQHKRATRAKAKAKQNRSQRAGASSAVELDPNDDRLDFESVDLTELFKKMRDAEQTSQLALCSAFCRTRCWNWCSSRKAKTAPPISSSRR